MKKIHRKRLMNVAKSLFEADEVASFTMEAFFRFKDADGRLVDPSAYSNEDSEIPRGTCGTPACALGHFAARTDLQRFLKPPPMFNPEYDLFNSGVPVYATDGEPISIDDNDLEDYFGINWIEVERLFGADGCGGAKTPVAAAKFIERFVAKKIREQQAR